MKNRLLNQVAIITGANSGIGAGVAMEMAGEGATVILNYPFVEARKMADEIAEKINLSGNRAFTYQADVSNETEVMEMFSWTIRKFGTLDILVNNAGIQQDAAFHEMSLKQWNRVMNVNLTGQFLCAREAVKEFMRRGVDGNRSSAAGKIICMSSVHEVIPWAGHVNYAASKGGVMLMMKSMAQELAPYKIRINSIGPGAIKTPINKSAWETPEAEMKLLELIPYNRVGETADIGKAAVWLASDESDYVNGTTLFVDGGMTLYPGFATNG